MGQWGKGGERVGGTNSILSKGHGWEDKEPCFKRERGRAKGLFDFRLGNTDVGASMSVVGGEKRNSWLGKMGSVGGGSGVGK